MQICRPLDNFIQQIEPLDNHFKIIYEQFVNLLHYYEQKLTQYLYHFLIWNLHIIVLTHCYLLRIRLILCCFLMVLSNIIK